MGGGEAEVVLAVSAIEREVARADEKIGRIRVEPRAQGLEIILKLRARSGQVCVGDLDDPDGHGQP